MQVVPPRLWDSSPCGEEREGWQGKQEPFLAVPPTNALLQSGSETPNLRDFLRLSNTGAPLGVIAAMATRGQQSRPGRSLAEDGQVQAGSWHFTEAGV